MGMALLPKVISSETAVLSVPPIHAVLQYEYGTDYHIYNIQIHLHSGNMR